MLHACSTLNVHGSTCFHVLIVSINAEILREL